MTDEELMLIDETKSTQWNYVRLVERELKLNSDYTSIPTNPFLPKSYKEVIMTLTRACNHSRVALLIDEDETYVAFMLVVDEDYIPFLLDDLDNIKVPTNCIYKVFPDSKLATSKTEDGLLTKFIYSTVLQDLNKNIESWTHFKSS